MFHNKKKYRHPQRERKREREREREREVCWRSYLEPGLEAVGMLDDVAACPLRVARRSKL